MAAAMAWAQSLQWMILGVLLGLSLAMMYATSIVIELQGPEKGALIPKDGLGLGTSVPSALLVDHRTGQSMNLGETLDLPTMLIFLGENCLPCEELEPHLNWVARHYRDVRLVAIVDVEARDSYLQRLRSPIWVAGDHDRTLATAFDVQRIPLTYMVSVDGTVQMRAVANRRLDLEDLIYGVGHLQEAPWTEMQ